ncbi:MAG TPA: peptidylprolyl isomerase [Candidatus Dormibacteraeota bacterium]|nr:peptidylprolyl isomerase [Candidatus Dormibacteraeota bacterium]
MFRRSNLVFPMLILGTSLLLGCGKTSKTETASEPEKGTVETMPRAQNPTPQSAAAPGTMPVAPATPPDHVQVQHILIGFVGSVQGKPITRSKEEAKTLAYQILDRARRGEDFDALVKQYTDDSPPGIYGMSGNGVAPAQGEYPRTGMVPAFGNVGFAISVGNIGIADYDPQASPFGWHIIKRLK